MSEMMRPGDGNVLWLIKSMRIRSVIGSRSLRAVLPHSRKKLYLISGGITYAEGVIAGSPGLQCEASYPGFKSPLLLRCKRCCNSFPVGNNPFGVACFERP